jgi:small subunit ribosomal protein S16
MVKGSPIFQGTLRKQGIEEEDVAVVIRLKRVGRRNRPFYRVGAADRRAPRDGKVIENLGTYDPYIEDDSKKAVLKKDRIEYWLSVGAVPSDKVKVLLKKAGIKVKK